MNESQFKMLSGIYDEVLKHFNDDRVLRLNDDLHSRLTLARDRFATCDTTLAECWELLSRFISILEEHKRDYENQLRSIEESQSSICAAIEEQRRHSDETAAQVRTQDSGSEKNAVVAALATIAAKQANTNVVMAEYSKLQAIETAEMLFVSAELPFYYFLSAIDSALRPLISQDLEMKLQGLDFYQRVRSEADRIREILLIEDVPTFLRTIAFEIMKIPKSKLSSLAKLLTISLRFRSRDYSDKDSLLTLESFAAEADDCLSCLSQIHYILLQIVTRLEQNGSRPETASEFSSH